MRRNRVPLFGGRALLWVVLYIGLSVSFAEPVQAQVPASSDMRYTFVLIGVPLQDALNTLIDKTKISLVYRTELVEGKTAFCRARQQPEEAILSCLLDGTGLDYYQLSSGTYVLFADPRSEPQYGQLAGQVVDAETGEPLTDAHVLLAYEDRGVTTNQAGRFAFASLKPGPQLLVVTHVAYHDRADTVWIPPSQDRQVGLSMTPRITMTAPVVINGFASRMPSEDLGLGRRSPTEPVLATGTGGGLQDIDAIVGVRVGDALSDVHVQGGASGEHQYRLDDATVFVPIQNGGFIGPFSPFAVRQITVQKAGFEASQGSHLSGVIDVAHDVAPARRQSALIQADPLSLNGRYSGKTGPEGRLRASWMVAGRASLWEQIQQDPLKDLFRTWSTPDLFFVDAVGGTARQEEAPPDPAFSETLPTIEVGFSDLHAALRVQLDGLHSLHISAYRGWNKFGDERMQGEERAGQDVVEIEDNYTWVNFTRQLRYEGVLSSRAFANASVWISSYTFAHPFDRSPFASGEAEGAHASTSEDLNDIDEIGVRVGWDYALMARHYLTGGVTGITTQSGFSLALDPSGTTPAVNAATRPFIRWRWSAFLEDAVSVNHRTTLTVGSRLTYLPVRQAFYAEPRLSVRYDLAEGPFGTWAFRAGVGVYRQFINQFDVATYGATALVPSIRFWLPLGAEERPPKAYHVTGAVLYRPNTVWQVGLESYYKHQSHLLTLDYGGQADGSADDLLTGADGYAYGTALSLRRQTQKAHLGVQYEYAIARRRLANRFDGAFVTAPWSAPHRFLASLDVIPLPSLTATVRWQGVVGRTWGFRQAYYDYLEPNPTTHLFAPFDLSNPEAHRLPTFSQWDVGLAYTRTVVGLRMQARLNVINVLGRRNVRDWSLSYDEVAAAYVRSARRSTPSIPSLSLRIAW